MNNISELVAAVLGIILIILFSLITANIEVSRYKWLERYEGLAGTIIIFLIGCIIVSILIVGKQMGF